MLLPKGAAGLRPYSGRDKTNFSSTFFMPPRKTMLSSLGETKQQLGI
jgi:hypothetical protein